MKTMKKFLLYFLIFLAFYFLSNLVSIGILKDSYKDTQFSVGFDSPKIELTESKSTFTNGFVKGKITNETINGIVGKYLKLDFFNKRDNNIGTKYVDFGNLASGESKDFVSRFNFDGVESVKASLIDEAELPKNRNLLDFSLDDLKFDKYPWYIWFGALIIIAG